MSLSHNSVDVAGTECAISVNMDLEEITVAKTSEVERDVPSCVVEDMATDRVLFA